MTTIVECCGITQLYCDTVIEYDSTMPEYCGITQLYCDTVIEYDSTILEYCGITQLYCDTVIEYDYYTRVLWYYSTMLRYCVTDADTL